MIEKQILEFGDMKGDLKENNQILFCLAIEEERLVVRGDEWKDRHHL
jgi:hypothetical protein